MCGAVFLGCALPDELSSFLQRRIDTSKHRKHVNGLIKLERNLWISDKADQLDAASISGDMHAMYTQVGAITKYAKHKLTVQKVCRVSNAEGLPTQLYAVGKRAFRDHFLKRCQPKPSLMVK